MDSQGQVLVKEKQKEKVRIKKRYNCVYINDDTTTFEFVVESLIDIFHRTREDAERITLMVHNNGRGIANSRSLSKDIALTKQDEVVKMARAAGFPLKVIIEEI